jgi:hypothetical protein
LDNRHKHCKAASEVTGAFYTVITVAKYCGGNTSIICGRMKIIKLNDILTTDITHMALTVNRDGRLVADQENYGQPTT